MVHDPWYCSHCCGIEWEHSEICYVYGHVLTSLPTLPVRHWRALLLTHFVLPQILCRCVGKLRSLSFTGGSGIPHVLVYKFTTPHVTLPTAL